ncbi:hypothetical protein WICANDRAFT_67584 [Wickerhamomyces anomalus NRRL Y-366-8]|uniref:F-box domain-containing protein n=1 Tax=Wickerhamomyces anomalus (strain ATCC 58044 / CBS 1984 / NCYC 433 / NRRL Y-366-8) TaxID=683960 RepID=A0A1E3P7U0_WICAA|nr:uncharacterized protein WICANDRAFT_67584 [Wickerhamomyces anomalus NRRL Y-366-8]ODQ60937.1 hypothetical protein WICANDRAFT_67584 [Wickerhamomyces anomalus NRRL Y-366-8]
MVSLLSFPQEIVNKITCLLYTSDLISITKVQELEPIWRYWIILTEKNLDTPQSITYFHKDLNELRQSGRTKPHLLIVALRHKGISSLFSIKVCEYLTEQPPYNISILGLGNVTVHDFLIIVLMKNLSQSTDDMIHPIEIRGSKIHLWNLPIQSFFAPEVKYLKFSSAHFLPKVGHPIVTPNLEKMELIETSILECPELLTFPMTTKFKDCFFDAQMLQNDCYFEPFKNVKTLEILSCAGFKKMLGLEFPSLERLIIINDLGTVQISNIKAPKLGLLSVRSLEETVRIEDCQFGRLERFEFSGSAIDSCKKIWAPNLKDMEIAILFDNDDDDDLNFNQKIDGNLFGNVSQLTMLTRSIPYIDTSNLLNLEYLHLAEKGQYDHDGLSFIKAPNLKTLCLTDVIFADNDKLKLEAPNLEVLSLRNCSIDYDIFQDITTLFPKLKVFRYVGPFFRPGFSMTPEDLKWSFCNQKLPELETFIIHFNTKLFFDMRSIDVSFENCHFPKLKMLSVYHFLSDLKLCKLEINAPHLRFLSVQGFERDGADLSDYKELKALYIRDSSLYKIPESDQLEYLNVQNCSFESFDIENFKKLIECHVMDSRVSGVNITDEFKGRDDFVIKTKEELDANMFDLFLPDTSLQSYKRTDDMVRLIMAHREFPAILENISDL